MLHAASSMIRCPLSPSRPGHDEGAMGNMGIVEATKPAEDLMKIVP